MPSKLVLVVDPDIDSREILSWFLEMDGFVPVRVARADAALELIPGMRPDLIVGEHPLFLEDGRLLCEAIRADPATAGIPFLAVTSWVGGASLEAARCTHDAVVTKPCDRKVFHNLLHEMLHYPEPADPMLAAQRRVRVPL